MDIVYAVTEGYQDRLIPSVRSLLEHNPDAHIYVVTETDEVPGIPCKAINISGQTTFPEDGVNYHNRFTYINLVKVCYPSLLPLNKVIHIDADTIIRSSLLPIWNIELTGKWFAACPEIQQFYRPFGDVYFNMGIAVINLAQMRRDKTEKIMAGYLNEVPQEYADQDAWNKYGIEEGKIVPLSNKYNSCWACGYNPDPAIVHYCGISDWWTSETMPGHEYLRHYQMDQ